RDERARGPLLAVREADVDRRYGERLRRRSGRARVPRVGNHGRTSAGLRRQVSRCRRRGAGQRLQVRRLSREHAQDAPRAVAELARDGVLVEVVAGLVLRAAGTTLEDQGEPLRAAVLERVELSGFLLAVSVEIPIVEREA